MRKLLLNLTLGLTALVLLIAVVLGILLATFNPNDYKEYFSRAAYKATGRQLVFQGDIAMSFFPTLGLKTGKLTMSDVDGFGTEPFMTVDSASVAVAVEPLLEKRLEVQEISLHGLRLKLATNAAGENNWETGFGAQSAAADKAAAKGQAEAIVGQSGQGGGQGGVEALAPPAGESAADKEAKEKAFVLRVQEFASSGAALVYRDMRGGKSYSGSLNDFSVTGLGLDTDMNLELSGNAQDESSGLKGAFTLKSSLRIGSGGAVSADIEALSLKAEGLVRAPVTLTGRGKLAVAEDKSLRLTETAGSVRIGPAKDLPEVTSSYTGALHVAPASGQLPLRLDAQLVFDSLDLDALLAAQGSGPAAAGSPEGSSGAPNLPKPKVSGAQNRAAAPRQPDKAGPLLPDGIKADLELALGSLKVAGIPMRNLKSTLKVDRQKAEAPFSLDLFGGRTSGTLWADLKGHSPVVRLAAQARGLDLAAITALGGGKYSLTGSFASNLDVTAAGLNADDLLGSLKGRAEAEALGGEVRGFKLIPADLPNFKAVPEVFAYKRIAVSADIVKGTATSRDILLDSPVITGRGGGTVRLPQRQADIGINFKLADMPPAVPVNITGPFSNLSYSVDMRTFLRNVAESAQITPETAVDLLRNPKSATDMLRRQEETGKNLLRDMGGKLFKK